MNNANQIIRLQFRRRQAGHTWVAGNALLTVLFCLSTGSCTSACAFAPRFFQSFRHRNALALRYHFTSIRL
jgi:hypothetical protein